MEWDENPAREQGEALIARIQQVATLEEAKAAADELARMSKLYLNWAWKAGGRCPTSRRFRYSFARAINAGGEREHALPQLREIAHGPESVRMSGRSRSAPPT
jgi:hypothetical protein